MLQDSMESFNKHVGVDSQPSSVTVSPFELVIHSFVKYFLNSFVFSSFSRSFLNVVIKQVNIRLVHNCSKHVVNLYFYG